MRLIALRVQSELDRILFHQREETLLELQARLELMVSERTHELRASQQRVTAFAEAASDWFWEMGPDLRFTYFSERVEEVVGIPVEFHIGKTREELAGEDAQTPKWRKHLRDLEQRRPFRDFRYLRRGPDGRLQYLTTSGKPVFDENGEFAGYVGTGSDLTPKMEAEERMRLANESIAAAVDAYPYPISLWDTEDRLVIANRAFLENAGGATGSINAGLSFRDFVRILAEGGVVKEAVGREAEWIEERCRLHNNPGETFEQRLHDGTWLMLREHRLPAGATMTVSTDISRLKKAEAETRLNRDRLEDFSSVAADWFWEQDEHLRFTYISSEAIDVTGLPKSELLGKTRSEIAGRGGGENQFADHERLLQSHTPFDDFRFSQMRPDGSRVFMSVSGKPIFDRTGAFSGYRGAGRDITAIVEAEEALRVEKDKAEAANKAKSEFLAQMSHDFRTPLNAILGFSQMIAEGALGPVDNDRYQEYAGDIFRSGQLLLDLVNNLLDISKIEAGELTLDKTTLDLEGTVAEVRRLMEPRFQEKSLTFTTDVEPGARRILADRRALWHMLTNLLSNAVKFTPEQGEIALEARHKSGEIVISVNDSGIGFDPAERGHVLSPFGRGQNARASNIEGTGLGLPIVKAMVEAHDGRFELVSKKGCGTRASLIFPLKGCAAAPLVDGQAA